MEGKDFGKTLLRIFYQSIRPRVVDSNTNSSTKPVTAGLELDSDSSVRNEDAVQADQCLSPLHDVLVAQEHIQGETCCTKHSTESHRKSFVPIAIKLFNSTLGWSDNLSQKTSFFTADIFTQLFTFCCTIII